MGLNYISECWILVIRNYFYLLINEECEVLKLKNAAMDQQKIVNCIHENSLEFLKLYYKRYVYIQRFSPIQKISFQFQTPNEVFVCVLMDWGSMLWEQQEACGSSQYI